MIAVGLMAGTSLDGIDAVRIAIRPRGAGFTLATEAFAIVPLPAELRTALAAALPPARADALAVSRLHAALGEAFAAAALAVGGADADYIASHGVTFAHAGDERHTLQLGDPFRIREATGRTVIADFRAADTAAGGQGAPLVPYVDALLLGDPYETRIALNLGGIANLTVLAPGGAPADALAFDCGPANLPIDAYLCARTGDRERFDRDGQRALRGRVDPALLQHLLEEPYFALVPPKSTGRERFGASFVARHRAALDALDLDGAIATLTALSVASVAAAVKAYGTGASRVIVSGGGARNRALVDGLRAALPTLAVESSAGYGIDPDAKEAIAFAVLGYATLCERAAGLPRVTGARGPRVLGSIAPAGLRALLANIDCEVRAG